MGHTALMRHTMLCRRNDVMQPQAQGFGLLPAKNGFCLFVPLGNAALIVHANNGIQRCIKHRAQVALALAHPFINLLHFGDFGVGDSGAVLSVETQRHHHHVEPALLCW